jgi:hypothetical protein
MFTGRLKSISQPSSASEPPAYVYVILGLSDTKTSLNNAYGHSESLKNTLLVVGHIVIKNSKGKNKDKVVPVFQLSTTLLGRIGGVEVYNSTHY